MVGRKTAGFHRRRVEDRLKPPQETSEELRLKLRLEAFELNRFFRQPSISCQPHYPCPLLQQGRLFGGRRISYGLQGHDCD